MDWPLGTVITLASDLPTVEHPEFPLNFLFGWGERARNRKIERALLDGNHNPFM